MTSNPNSPLLKLKDQVVVVTGGGRGIGRAHCLLLAERGARVVVNDLGGDRVGADRSTAPADDVVAEIVARGQSAIANYNDISTEAGATALVEAAVATFGRIDSIIHNAGVTTIVPLLEQTERSYRATVSASLDGGYYLARAAWPHMIAQHSGRIVMTGSSIGMFGQEGSVPYAAAKAGLVGMVRALALEGAAHGIHVNMLCVGAHTRLTRLMFERQEMTPALEAVEEWWAKYLTPEQVAPVALYLVHPDSQENGECLEVIGGRVGRYFTGLTAGFTGLALTPEEVRDNLARVMDQSNYATYRSAGEHGQACMSDILAAGADPIDAISAQLIDHSPAGAADGHTDRK